MIIYLATNKENNKSYVGLTRQSLARRIRHHLHSPSFFGRALRKYGREAFEFKVIDYAESSDELSQKEKYWIADLNTVAPSGYNLTTGGESAFVLHPSTIKKLREKAKRHFQEHPSRWNMNWDEVGGADSNKARQIRKVLRRHDPVIGKSIRERERIRRARQKASRV